MTGQIGVKAQPNPALRKLRKKGKGRISTQVGGGTGHF